LHFATAVFDSALLFFFPLEKRVQAAEGRGGRGDAEHTTKFMSLINGKIRFQDEVSIEDSFLL
jgi:hypothetical protein